MATAEAFGTRVRALQARSEQVLTRLLPIDDAPTARLCEAMRYSVLGGGKRLRPILVYVSGEALGAPPEALDAAAAAVEIIHAYSLIHDDLPAMDDDDLRRGRPSCHRAFDEGTAILAGDALQALAFEVLAQGTGALPDAARLQLLVTLSRAIGTLGMAGGQAIDLANVGRSMRAPDIELMHRRKTGALIQASVEMGAIAAGTTAGVAFRAISEYGAEIGLAFQIQDDILDVVGDTTTMGKMQGADAALGKPNYPSVMGLDAARAAALSHRDRALAALGALDTAAPLLKELAHFVVDRAH
jgi:farnesyl diphosphate synthase/geranylgeranyl diphosphate synthase type II